MQQRFHNERQEKNIREVKDMTTGYENEILPAHLIKDMIRKMIKDELRIDFYDNSGGVEVKLTLGDETIQEELFYHISGWN